MEPRVEANKTNLSFGPWTFDGENTTWRMYMGYVEMGLLVSKMIYNRVHSTDGSDTQIE